jgi:O-antigen ligase
VIGVGRDWLPLSFEELDFTDALVLTAVIGLPWAFGGVEVWAFRGAAALLAVAASLSMVKHGWRGLGLDRGAIWLLPAVLLGAWGVLQITPAPPELIRVLSPRADSLYRETFPGYPGAGPDNLRGAIEDRALERVPEVAGLPLPGRESEPLDFTVRGRWSGWRTISLLPSAGIERLFWYFALLLGFLQVRRRCRDPEVAAAYRDLLFAGFVALAVFGLIYAATGNGKLYWVRETLQSTRPFGPYVNPTNFAGMMELATPWIAGYAVYSLRYWKQGPWLARTTPIFAAGALLCLFSAVATANRTGTALIAGSLILLALFVVHGWRQRLVVVVGSALAVVVGGLILSKTLLAERVRDFVDATGGSYTEVDRLVSWRAALEMFSDFRIVGSGFGSFRDVFPHYMPTGEFARWAQLHNDYLEVLVEGGAIAAVLVLWLIVAYWRRALRGTSRPAGAGVDPEALGLLLGLAALSIHAVVDFNHQIPANALMFTTLAAVAVARGEHRNNGEQSR